MNHGSETIITSAKNPQVQQLRRLLTQAKYRREQGATLLDGVHVCESYLDAGRQPQQVVIGESAWENPEVVQLVSRVEDEQAIITVSDSIIRSISPVEHGVGIVFVIAMPTAKTTLQIDDDALLLDGVQDPGNMGTLLRTAAAAGVRKIYMSHDSASAWAPKVLRAGMGAQFGLDIHENCQLEDLVVAATVPVYATSLAAERTIYDAELSGPAAWLFGSEGRGVSAELLQRVDKTVIIPQESSVESLNVAAAVAVCLFEQRRQRMVH